VENFKNSKRKTCFEVKKNKTKTKEAGKARTFRMNFRDILLKALLRLFPRHHCVRIVICDADLSGNVNASNTAGSNLLEGNNGNSFIPSFSIHVTVES
jgi:hypothetical protein